MIWSDGRGWLPCRVASRALTSVITSQYVDPYPSWRAIPKLTLERWFDKFGEKVDWLPEHNFQIKNIFNTKGSMCLSDMLMQARKKRKCPTWMGESVWNDFEKVWMDPSYKEISNRAKKNRVSSKGGAVHTGGSISIAEHTIRMSYFAKIFCCFSFLAKFDSHFVHGKLQQASKGGEASSSCSQVVNAEARLDMWVQSVGGKNKGRIYGAGDRSSLYRPGVASLVPDSRPSRGCANFLSQQSNEIAAQIAAFEERAKAAEHEAREMQLATLAKSVASIQAESSRRRRHPDYYEDESNDDDGEE
ncbi:uncharacterized protein [Cicer arietinum]|uniref:uncharacterized protein n=1 Tax=Cicer arietinum TaxID=3827 RepID=UPI003CC5C98E